MKIKWRDAYVCNNTNDRRIKRTLGKHGICTSHGKLLYENKHYVVLKQNHFKGYRKHSDYIVIPKGCVIK